MTTAKLFKNGQSQAVRLPKEFRFKGSKVYIKKMGNGLLLLPEESGKNWDTFFEVCNKFSDDFMKGGRDLLPIQDREPIL